MSLPTEDDISRALKYLAQTDEQYAKETARVKALEHEVKTIKALSFLDADGTMAEKEAKSSSSESYRAWINTYENAVADRETTAAKRKRAELTIEVWRSLNANRRQG
jgi:hypothetical protein